MLTSSVDMQNVMAISQLKLLFKYHLIKVVKSIFLSWQKGDEVVNEFQTHETCAKSTLKILIEEIVMSG